VENPGNVIPKEEKKQINLDLNNGENVDNLENIPAYLRKKMTLNSQSQNPNSTPSNTTISNNKNFILRENNPYLHDNVD